MSTTIQISDSVKEKLDKMKIMNRETYNDIIEILIEDNLELNEETKRDLEMARKQVKRGEVFSHEEVAKELGL